MYSDYTMECVRQNLGLEENDKSMDTEIEEMNKIEVLERYLQWNNLVGFADEIVEVINDIYNLSLELE